jgi:prepilin-type N-terminal cleavage/methylation domain-containing protein
MLNYSIRQQAAMIKHKKDQKGFTIVELLIATTVFSIILIVIVYAVLFISHNFIRGSIESQTQETARSIIQDISQQAQLTKLGIGGVVTKTTSANEGFVCIGDTQYTYVLNSEIDASDTSTTSTTVPHALVSRYLPDCGTSSDPQDISTNPLIDPGKELLGNHMRLGQFQIQETSASSNLYCIDIVIGYGDDTNNGGALIVQSQQPNPCAPPQFLPYSYTCTPSVLYGDFCATASLNSMVQSRVTSGD